MLASHWGRLVVAIVMLVPTGIYAQTRLLWDNADPEWGTISADGRFLSAASGIRDLSNQKTLPISLRVIRDPKLDWIEGSVIAPDGRRVAYAVYRSTATGGRYSVHVVNADGSGEKEVYPGSSFDRTKGESYYLFLFSWSRDGRWILAREHVGRPATERAILISPEGGGMRVAYPSGGAKSSFELMQDLTQSPDGKWLAFSGTRGGEVESYVCTLRMDLADAQPVQLTKGRVFDWTPNGSHIVLARSAGEMAHMYIARIQDGKLVGNPQRIDGAPAFDGKSFGITRRGAILFGQRNYRAEVHLLGVDRAGQSLGPVEFRERAFTIGHASMGGAGRFSPDGSRVLLTLPDSEIWIRPLGGTSGKRLKLRLQTLTRVDWAADGKTILVSGSQEDGRHGLFRIDPVTGDHRLICLEQSDLWAPTTDGTAIYVRSGSRLASIDLRTGNRAQVSANFASRPVDMRFSPDGRKVALFGAESLEILEIRSGTVTTIREGATFNGGDWDPGGDALWAVVRSGRNRQVERISLDGSDSLVLTYPGQYRGLRLSPDGKRMMLFVESRTYQVWSAENSLPRAAVDP